MSVTPDALKQLMAGGGGTAAAPGPNPMAAAAPGNEGPGAGPMATPQPKEGVTQAAMVNVTMAMQLLEQSLPAFGSASEQGKSILSALKSLTSVAGENRQQAESLIPAELMQLMQSIPGAGGGGPAAQAMGSMPATQSAMPTA